MSATEEKVVDEALLTPEEKAKREAKKKAREAEKEAKLAKMKEKVRAHTHRTHTHTLAAAPTRHTRQRMHAPRTPACFAVILRTRVGVGLVGRCNVACAGGVRRAASVDGCDAAVCVARRRAVTRRRTRGCAPTAVCYR